jgi:L-seryl-tRNA(Ser) seleniumtransferase
MHGLHSLGFGKLGMSDRIGQLPSVDDVLRTPAGRLAVSEHGHVAAVGAVRSAVDEVRRRVRTEQSAPEATRAALAEEVAAMALDALAARAAPRLRRVYNLTGTVLHTNLGRALLAATAIEAASSAMRWPAAVEYDLESGRRGERDHAVRDLVCELTGAESALLVNNNAAAVLLVLNTLALGRETIVSRGELIEIGGSFRMPDIMSRAGTRLVEVGTTNRTHPADYQRAIGADTALLMKVHTSNYRIEGFTTEVSGRALAKIGREHGVPVVDDLGSGTLVDLARYGLARERTVADAIADGADLVTFSGDKLLGGPQAGFVIGRRDLVAACAKNPLKRALRLDKVRLGALEATLKLYRDPDRLAERLPTLRYLTRPLEELRWSAEELVAPLATVLGAGWQVTVIASSCQIGSGALPLETLQSVAVAVAPHDSHASGRAVEELAAAFRRLAVPVIGRIEKGAFVMDVRCLDDVAELVGMLDQLVRVPLSAGPGTGH